MLETLALIAVAAALFFWLWRLYRGGWVRLAMVVINLLSVALVLVVGFISLVALLLVVVGVMRRDLSAVAGAIVLFAVPHLLLYLVGRVTELKPFRYVGELIERTL